MTTTREPEIPGPNHPITIKPTGVRVVARAVASRTGHHGHSGSCRPRRSTISSRSQPGSSPTSAATPRRTTSTACAACRSSWPPLRGRPGRNDGRRPA